MKEKSFKLGSTYKLKKKYVNDFKFDDAIRREFGLTSNGVFSFTVGHISEGIAAYRVYVEEGGVCVAYTCERYMFKRVDNKE